MAVSVVCIQLKRRKKLKEVTDPQELFKIRYSIQNIPLMMNTNTQVQMLHAWSLTDGWYRVNLVINQQRALWGILFIERNELYLDTISTLVLVEERIQANLDAFNAGYHWRYKGL